MRIAWWLWMGLAGCTPQGSLHMASGPHNVSHYVAQPVQPANCGTPEEFKFCINIPPPIIPVARETLPDLTEEADDADTVLHRLRNRLSVQDGEEP